MNIPIKKHTKVRRPVSRYITYIMLGTYNVPFDLEGNSPLTLVQDIRKLENPLNVDPIFGYDNSGRLVEIPKRYHMCSPDKCYERKWGELVNTCGYPKQQKGDWNEWHKDMEESLREQDNFNKKHKETISLLTRIKRIGRAKK